MNESRIIMHEGCAVFVNRSTALLVKETSWNCEVREGVEGVCVPLALMVDGQKTFDFSMWHRSKDFQIWALPLQRHPRK